MTVNADIQATLPGSHCHICQGSTWQISKCVSERSLSIHTDVKVTCIRCNYSELRHFEFHQFQLLHSLNKHTNLLRQQSLRWVHTCITTPIRHILSVLPNDSSPVHYIRLL